MKKTGRVWKILTPILAVLMIVSIVAIPVTASFDNAINVALGAKRRRSFPEKAHRSSSGPITKAKRSS